MTTLVVEYETDGTVSDWRYEADDNYEPDSGEMVPTGHIDHRELASGKRVVDTSSEPHELVDNPDHNSRSQLEVVQDEVDNLVNEKPVRRQKVSEQSKQYFRDAHSNDDIQTQLDILFEIVTGESV